MDYLPLFLNIKNKPCLIVGGGVIAERKVSILMRAQASITIIAPDVTSEIKRKLGDQVTWQEKKFTVDDLGNNLSNYQIVIAATDDRKVNAEVAQLCRDKNILVNTADDSKNCDFILPSIIDRSPVQIAVSTGGASPVLARMLRTKLENCTPASYGHLAKLIEDNRVAVKEKFSTIDKRRKFWEKVLQGPIAELVFANQSSAAQKLLDDSIQQADDSDLPQGEVYLVGAGPGDPDLLTFRALRLMQQADVVVYDRLVSQEIMDLVRKDAEHIYAGKERSQHTLQQESINELLVRLAKEGKRVLRLKGGDPFIFGRGGEEIDSLVDENIPFQVVPGITAAAGCAAYAGIPLTHREYSQAVIFATGHLKDGTVDLNWEMLAHSNQTLVFYMGLHGLQIICDSLIKHGLNASTPAALIMQGTTANQRNIIGSLENLPKLVEKHDVKPPTLVIIGDVVKLHSKLNWFNPEEDVTAGAVKAFGSGNV
ncbi:MAG: siroheme synthase CysG [Gammaproteobacteria bacterium]|nr:siroheme synthase CysG [Gammaproteobacteria bacterium]